MYVRYLNLSVKDEKERKDILKAVEKVLIHGRIVLGPEVEQLEKEVAAFCGVKYSIGVNSGTDALYLALRALDVGRDDEVITTCLSWVATANAISLTGAKPVFIDIRDDFNIDPYLIEKAITSKTKAIVPVHFTGKVCEMDKLMKVARQHGLLVVEDAAQAFGASFNGRRAGSFGNVASYSMNPMKVFAACGEAGMILTNDDSINEKIRALRYNGTPDRTEAHYISLNARLDTMQAAILLERFKRFDDNIRHRRVAAEYYSRALDGIVRAPKEGENSFDVYYIYNILCERRDELMKYLLDRGIETKVNHQLLMPLHRAYDEQSSVNWPVGMEVTKNSLCLPIHENITQEEQDYVIEHIGKFYSRE